MTMRLRASYGPYSRLPERNNRHISCGSEHTGASEASVTAGRRGAPWRYKPLRAGRRDERVVVAEAEGVVVAAPQDGPRPSMATGSGHAARRLAPAAGPGCPARGRLGALR